MAADNGDGAAPPAMKSRLDAALLDNVFQPIADRFTGIASAFGLARFMYTGTAAFLLIDIVFRIYTSLDVFWSIIIDVSLSLFCFCVLFERVESQNLT